jgi:competence protein ComEC
LSILRVRGWDHVRATSPPAWWSLATAIDRLRTRAAEVLAARIHPERAGLAAAILLGERGGLSRELADEFVVTGTIHVLAISGLHVGLLAAGLFIVLRGFGLCRQSSGVAVAAVTGLYMLLVGAGTPVVRATILVWIACAAVAVGRRPATINSLAVAAIVICMWRPSEVFSTGAQLSFLSTAILTGVASILCRPREFDPIERLIERSRSWSEKRLRLAGVWLGAGALASAAVWLATAPLVAYRFHVVSLVGLVINVFVAAVVPVAMACGFLCLLTSIVPGPLASIFGAGCDGSLAVIEALVSHAAAVPGGHAWVAGPQGWWVAGWYAVMVVAFLVLRADLLRRAVTWATLVGAWSIVGIGGEWAAEPMPTAGLRVVMAAVGHGCGIVVRSPTGRCLVYDAGRLGAPAAGRRSIEAVLWSERITRIDTLVISHADADHFNAVPALLKRFHVGEILVPEPLLRCPSLSVTDLLAAAEAWGVPVRTAHAGDSFAVDPLCRARVLHPFVGGEPRQRSNNETSLVIAIEAAGRRVLLTGDIEGEALRVFAAAAPGECDVLVAPHHGSRTSLPADIAVATAPKVVLVSGRNGRSWPDVQSAYASAAVVTPEAVLQTGHQGALAVTLTAQRVAVEQFIGGRWRPTTLPLDHVVEDEDDVVTMAMSARSPTSARSTSWLATYAPSSMSTPLVKP